MKAKLLIALVLTVMPALALAQADRAIGKTGSPVPNFAETLGCTDGTNLRALACTSSGGVTLGATKAEDAARADADALIEIGAVRDDALVANQETTTDLDLAPLRTDNYGSLWTHPLTTAAVLTDTAVVDTNIYASGDCVDAAAEALTGTAATAPFLSGTITDVVITDLQAQAANIDVVFFNADPGNICASINSAADIDDDDLAKVIGVVHVTDHVSLNDNSVSQALNQNIHYALASGTTLYYGLISRGTPTYGTASDLVIKVKVVLD